jgi:hypothetical protein
MTAESLPLSFGLWSPPGAAFSIKYSLPLLHEIDFFVADGYRRIPHGGLEVGGLLFGTEDAESLAILAYQPIECQHLFGPSFVLSDADIGVLRLQIEKPFHDETHGELKLLGWFVSHGRSDLKLTDRELEVFDELFAGPRQVTMLVKPEKFKPTRYGFLARPRRGRLADLVCRDTFLLPLSVSAQPPSRSSRTAREAAEAKEPAATEGKPLEPSTEAVEPAKAPTAPPATPIDSAPVEPTAALTTDERPLPAPVGPALRPVGEDEFVPFEGPRRRKPESADDEAEAEGGKTARRGVPRWLEFAAGAAILLLSVAGVLWAYFSFLLPPIPLHADVRAGSTVVTWPPELTGEGESSLTVWTAGQRSDRVLTADEQRSGSVVIANPGADSIVQLLNRRWSSVRRGQLRLIQVPPAPRPPPVRTEPRRRRHSAESPEGAAAPVGEGTAPAQGTPAGTPPDAPPQGAAAGSSQPPR